MPGAARRMYPARTRRRWLGTSASAGSSRRVRRALTGPHTEYPPSRFGANERTRRSWFGILVVVPDEQLTRDDRVLRVRFAADPASVPGARRFVADGLRAWGLDA